MKDELLAAIAAPGLDNATIAALADWQADRIPGYRALFERHAFNPLNAALAGNSSCVHECLQTIQAFWG